MYLNLLINPSIMENLCLHENSCKWKLFSNKKCHRNNKCFDWQIWKDAPPTLATYTDGGKEHCSNFLSVQIAMIALQHFRYIQTLKAVRTALGHSYTNPPEKINCILDHGHNANLGLDLKSKFLIVLGFMMEENC